jgi:hypothetical protein
MDDILSIDEYFFTTKKYNNVIVSDAEVIDTAEQYIIIELDKVRNNNKSGFCSMDKQVFVRVFSNTDNYNLYLTGGTCEKIAIGEIAEQPAEIVPFVYSQQGSLSKPINTIKSFTWYGIDLGAVSHVVNTQAGVMAANATSTSIGVASVVYDSKYDVWLITPPGYTTTKYELLALAAQGVSP